MCWSGCSRVSWCCGHAAWNVSVSQNGERTFKTSAYLCKRRTTAPLTLTILRVSTLMVLNPSLFVTIIQHSWMLVRLFSNCILLSVSPDPKPERKTLKWAISQFASVERIMGQDKYFCETCHHYTEAERSLLFDKTPEVITIHLKCFAANGSEYVFSTDFNA